MFRTCFHGSKGVRPIEVRLYKADCHLHLPVMCWAPLYSSYLQECDKGCGPVHLILVKTSVFTATAIIRILNDSRDWTLTVSVGRRFPSLIPNGEKAKLKASTLQYGTRYLVMSSCSSCAEGLKNSGCWYFN